MKMSMKIIICNAFSLSMLNRDRQSRVGDSLNSPRTPVPCPDPVEFIEDWKRAEPDVSVISAVGHADTAAVFSRLLGIDVPVNRISVTLDAEGKRDYDTILLIGQYIGPRLPEGATTLPEDARIEWWTV